MFSGRTTVELAQEIDRQAKAKRDIVADSGILAVVTAETEAGALLTSAIQETEKLKVREARLRVGEHEAFPLTDLAQQQLATKLDIPWRYWQRMLADAPDLLERNANRWLGKSHERRMIRTLDGKARAILSDRYRRIDNFEMAEVIFPEIAALGGKIVSAQITDTRLYVKVTFPDRQFDVQRFKKPGSHERIHEPIVPGFVWKNSEVGLGQNEIAAFIEVLVCSNGAIIEEFSSRSRHIGRRVGGGKNGNGGILDSGDEEAKDIWSDETKKADDKALQLKVRDSIRAVADEARVKEIGQRIVDASAAPITGNPVKVVEELANNLQLDEQEGSSVLRHLIEGGDLSKWGLCQAVTRMSGDEKAVQNYDRATELEAAGGSVLSMAVNEWERIAASK